ncbi:MAG: hypothetical protein U5K38_01745 [Woeseiaceae bacterium]|nr:hypothetical protein [Woeseiaceae bacterium]
MDNSTVLVTLDYRELNFKLRFFWIGDMWLAGGEGGWGFPPSTLNGINSNGTPNICAVSSVN